MIRWPAKHEVLLGLCLVAAVLAVQRARRIEIETDLTQLLPAGSEAATDYGVFVDRFGAFEKVFILVAATGSEGPAPRAEVGAAAERLAALLVESPEIARVRSGIEPGDLEFLARSVAPRAPLLLDGDWLRLLKSRITPAAVRRRAALIRRRTLSPLGLYDRMITAADPFGFAEGLAGLEPRSAGLPVDAMTGAFLSRDGRSALLIATPTRAEIDAEGGRALAADLAAAVARLRTECGLELDVAAVGGPLYAAEDEGLLRRDLQVSLTGSAIGCALLLVLAFGSLRLPLIALATLAFGLILTAACIQIGLGRVTGVGLGFSAVLLGLGIDYSIHGAARYRDHLGRAGSPREALRQTLRRSGAGILVSALTTAGAFATLCLARFQPLRELGFLVAAGVLCILASSLALGAPLLLSIGPAGRSAAGPAPFSDLLGRFVDRSTGWSSRRAPVALALLTGLTAVSLVGLTGLRLDPDLQVFRSTEHTAHGAERALLERFGIGHERVHVVIPGADLDEVLPRARQVRSLVTIATAGRATVATPSDFLVEPRRLADRLPALGELRLDEAATRLESALRDEGLDPAYFASGFAALRDLAAGRDPAPLGLDDLPEWIAGSLRRDDEGISVALQVQAPVALWPSGPPSALLEDIRRSAPGSAVASISRVGSELRRLAREDLARLGGLAALVVVLIVLSSFRGDVRPSALALLPVALGAVWSLGLWAALGRTLDLVTLAVLPIIFGVGIDDGLHVLHAWRQSPGEGLLGALRESGKALVLTTLTTAVAFASLAATTVPGLRNAGLLVTLGVFCCLAATLTALPALESLLRPEARH